MVMVVGGVIVDLPAEGGNGGGGVAPRDPPLASPSPSREPASLGGTFYYYQHTGPHNESVRHPDGDRLVAHLGDSSGWFDVTDRRCQPIGVDLSQVCAVSVFTTDTGEVALAYEDRSGHAVVGVTEAGHELWRLAVATPVGRVRRRRARRSRGTGRARLQHFDQLSPARPVSTLARRVVSRCSPMIRHRHEPQPHVRDQLSAEHVDPVDDSVRAVDERGRRGRYSISSTRSTPCAETYPNWSS